MSLIKRFYTDPYLQLRSNGINLLAIAAFSLAFYRLHAPGFYHFAFAWRYILLAPLGLYAGGVSVVFIHNATHRSFPKRWLNECCGYLAGMHQLWGFTGWQLIHLVHHQYSDHKDMDPHNPVGLTFWQFCKSMPFRSNEKIRARYREHWGASGRTKLLQSRMFLASSNIAVLAGNLLFWFMLLGPEGFVFFYIPSFFASYMLAADINYAAHPKDPVTGQTHAINRDDTPYHKLANAMWSGIYYHANHHRRPLLYNPKEMTPSLHRDIKQTDIAA